MQLIYYELIPSFAYSNPTSSGWSIMTRTNHCHIFAVTWNMIELIQFIIFRYSEIAQHLPNLHFSSLDLLDCSDDERRGSIMWYYVYVLLIEVLEFEIRCFWLCQDEKMIISITTNCLIYWIELLFDIFRLKINLLLTYCLLQFVACIYMDRNFLKSLFLKIKKIAILPKLSQKKCNLYFPNLYI